MFEKKDGKTYNYGCIFAIQEEDLIKLFYLYNV